MKDNVLKENIVKATLISTLAVSVATNFTGCENKQMREFKELLDNGNYYEAVGYYQNNYENLKNESVDEVLQSSADSIYQNYLSGIDSAGSAIEALEEIKSIGSDDLEQYIKSKIDLINSDCSFKEGESYFESKNYLSAIEAYKAVISDDPNYSTAQSRIKECEKLYKEEIVNKAESFVKDTDYSKAIEYLLDFVDQFDDSSEIEDKIAEYQDKELDNALKDAEDFISKGDYYSALESIAELEKDYPNNKKLEDLKKSTQESYLETVLPIIDDYMDKKDYGSAFSVCTNALEVIPDSEELIKRRDTIEPLKPILLSEMKVSESEFFEQLTEHSATYEDVVGNTYDPGNLFRLHVYHDGWGNDEDGYAKIYLNSQYTTLEGVLATDNNSDKGDCIVTILGDDKVLFKEKFNRSSSPKKVKVDVKGKQWLKIMICYPEVDSDASSSDNYGYKSEVLLSGFSFSK